MSSFGNFCGLGLETWGGGGAAFRFRVFGTGVTEDCKAFLDFSAWAFGLGHRSLRFTVWGNRL